MTATIVEKINHLPEHLHNDVELYIDFLLHKYFFEEKELSAEMKTALDNRWLLHQTEKDKSLNINQLKEKMRIKYGI